MIEETLKSSYAQAFEVNEAVALESQTIKHMIEDNCAENGIPLPNVTSKIIEASKSDSRATTGVTDDLKAWDADFVKVDHTTLFDLILSADYLNIKSLLDLT